MQEVKNLYLEFVRGISAILVLLFHYNINYLQKTSRHFPFNNWGNDAVIIFFILSGCVINMSQSRKPRSGQSFLKNRLIRIYPQFSLGILLGMAVLLIIKDPMPSWKTLLGNFLMISTNLGYIVQCLSTNKSIWSLSYEIFFYLIFAISIGRRQKFLLFAWLLISLAALPFYFILPLANKPVGQLISLLAYSPIWLLGYYLYEYRNYFDADIYAAIMGCCLLPVVSRINLTSYQHYDPLKYLLFAIVSIPLFRYCLHERSAGMKLGLKQMILVYVLAISLFFKTADSALKSKIFFTLIPWLVILFFWWLKSLAIKKVLIKYVKRVGSVTGKYSYSLYIIHAPILIACAYSFSSFGLFLVSSLALIVIATFVLEAVIQEAIVGYFKGRQNKGKPISS